MKRFLLAICVMSVFLFGGCGKDKDKKSSARETLTASAGRKQEIPIIQSDDDSFFDFEEDEIKDFAFIDDEAEEGVTRGDDEAVTVAKNDVLGSEDDWDAELTLAWEDEADDEVNFQTVQFDLNKNEIRKDQQVKLAENVVVANDAVKTGKNIIVAGHCCPLGPPSFNMSLSERRAKVIRDEMIKKGIPKKNIQIVGCGSEIPVVLSDAEDKLVKIRELAANRRAEISIN